MSPIKLYLFSIYLCGFVFLQASVVADGQVPPADGTASKNKAKPADLIHFGDLIDVDVLGSTEFDWRGTLNPEGYLNGVDFVDEPIFALCRSEEAVARDVVEGYKKILRDPQVVVKIIDRSGRAISYLYGAVKRPQRFRIERPVRLNELIIISGGIDEKASGEIQILRSSTLNCEERERNGENSGRDLSAKIIKLNITDLIKGVDEANPVIVNGDIITVSEAEPIYVIGSVVNPRQINARSEMTLSRAIASAGGFTKNADTRNIIVFRRSKNETLRIELDFNKIESKEAEDLVLQKYDIIEIAQNGVDRRAFAPIVKVFENETKTFEMPLKIID